MSKIRRLYYKRKFSLPNYINEDIGLEIELEPGDDWKMEWKRLKKTVHELADPEANKPNIKKNMKIL